MQPPPTLWHADSMYPNPGYRYTGNLKRGDSAQLVRQMCTNYPCIWSIACSSMSLLPVGTTGTLHYCKNKFYIQYVLYYRHKYILVSMHLRLSVRLSSIETHLHTRMGESPWDLYGCGCIICTHGPPIYSRSKKVMQ